MKTLNIIRIFLFIAIVTLAVASSMGCGSKRSQNDPISPSDGTPTTQPSDKTGQQPSSKLSGNPVGSAAPNFAGVSNWINSKPLQITDLKGKVVLIDFWTYTCVNCIRTLPYLREWYQKYSDKGLVIVGVHTPEFEFEKNADNVAAAAHNYGVNYPIAQDNDYKTWDAFNNRYWPAKYLIDKDGIIRYTHFGEGNYDETEQKIRELLEGAGGNIGAVTSNPDKGPQPDKRAFSSDPATSLTRELYAGFERNSSFFGAYIGNKDYYENPNSQLYYIDPGGHENNFMYLQGLWTNGRENLTHARETQNYEDYVALTFYANSVNVVLEPKTNKPFKVQVTIDGKPLVADNKGIDVTIDAQGNSYINVSEPKMYNVVRLHDFGAHDLKLSSNSADFTIYAFTFGAYPDVP